MGNGKATGAAQFFLFLSGETHGRFLIFFKKGCL